MTKTKKRIFAILLAACIVLTMLPFSVFAAEGYVGMIDMNQYAYSFDSSYPAPFTNVSRSRAVRMSIGGNVAYCIEFGVTASTGIGYDSTTNWDGLSSSKKSLVNYALMFGYTGTTKYGGTVDQEYWATQVLIWQIAYDTVNTSWESSICNVMMGSGSGAISVYNQIKAQVYSYQTIPSFTATSASSAPVHELAYNSTSGKYEITLNDSNGVLSLFDFQQAGYSITRNGNSLKIESDKPQELVTLGAAKSAQSSSSAGIIKYWVSSGYQTLATYEPGSPGAAVQAYFALKMPIVQGMIEIAKTGSAFTSVVESETDYGILYQPVYTDKPLSGVVFNVIADEDIYTDDGVRRVSKDEVVDTITTGANGKATTKSLYLGKYRVEEISTAPGYVLDNMSHYVSLTTEDKAVKIVTESLELINERQTVTVSFRKDMDTATGSQDKPFKDVVYGLFAREEILPGDGTAIPADGLIELITPDENGDAVVTTDLPFGLYYIKELATCEGYILDEVEYDFVFVYPENDVKVVEIVLNDDEALVNEIIRGNVKLIKTDTNGNRLSGAVFELYTVDDILIGEYTTDANGEICVEDLSYGEYYWQEKAAPNGYVTDDTPYEFSVTKDGEEIAITATNKKADTPKTGDNSKVIVWLVVAALTAAEIGGIVWYRKKKAKKDAPVHGSE